MIFMFEFFYIGCLRTCRGFFLILDFENQNHSDCKTENYNMVFGKILI